jgi:hypothetical protein
MQTLHAGGTKFPHDEGIQRGVQRGCHLPCNRHSTPRQAQDDHIRTVAVGAEEVCQHPAGLAAVAEYAPRRALADISCSGHCAPLSLSVGRLDRNVPLGRLRPRNRYRDRENAVVVGGFDVVFVSARRQRHGANE